MGSNSTSNELIIKKLCERFKITESQAETKVKNKSVQMVLEIVLDETGQFKNELAVEVEKAKSKLIEQKAELEKREEKVSEKERKLEEAKSEFENLKKIFEKAETQEIKDRIRLFEVYNNFVLSNKEACDYGKYVAGAVAILSGTNLTISR